jgi:hypothetical protein
LRDESVETRLRDAMSECLCGYVSADPTVAGAIPK